LLVLKKYKKKQNLQKKKVKGPILRPEQNFTYKHRSQLKTKGGQKIHKRGRGNFEKKPQKNKKT
jgi:hypothetical protein